MSKILDYNGLEHYDEKIKNYIDEQEEVYIGTTEPTGDEKIWINPSGEESPIVTKDYVDGEIERVEGEIPEISVSDTGTATDEVQYITIDGVEKKLAGGSGSEYTFTNGLTESGGTVSNDYYNALRLGSVGGVNISSNNLFASNSKIYLSSMTKDVNSNSPQQSVIIANSTIPFDSRYPTENVSVTCGNSYYQDENNGKNSISLGAGLRFHQSQTVVGRYNIDDSTKDFIVGNGTSDSARSNALTVSKTGILQCTNVPAPPSTDGEYNLHCSIVNGVPTYSWKAEV